MAEIVLAGVTHDRNIAHQIKTGGVRGYDNHTRLQVTSGLGIGDDHNNRKFGPVGG